MRKFLIVLCSLLMLTNLSGQIINWEGSISNDWHEPLNWDTKTLPTATDEVRIENVAGPGMGTVELKSNASIKSLLLNLGVTLDIDDSAILSLKAATPFSNNIRILGNSNLVISKGSILIESLGGPGISIQDGILVNLGVIEISESEDWGFLIFTDGTLENHGDITIASGKFSGINNIGTVDNKNGGNIYINKDGINTSLTDAGLFNAASASVINNGTITIDSTFGTSFLNQGLVTNNSSLIINNAITSLKNNGKLINIGSITVDKASDNAFINTDTLENTGAMVITESDMTALVNQGYVINEGGITINSGSSLGIDNQSTFTNLATADIDVTSSTQAISNNSLLTNQGTINCVGGTGSGIFNDSLLLNLGGSINVSQSSQGIVNSIQDSVANFGTINLVAVNTGISNSGNFQSAGTIEYNYPDSTTVFPNSTGILNQPGATLLTGRLTIRNFGGRGIWNLGTFISNGKADIYDFRGATFNIGVSNVGTMIIADDYIFGVFGEAGIPTTGISTNGVLDVIGILNLTSEITQSLQINDGTTTVTSNGLLVINPFGQESMTVAPNAVFEVLGQLSITDELMGF